MDISSELSDLVNAYSNLSSVDQREELEARLKNIISVLYVFNSKSELLLVPSTSNSDFDLSSTYALVCCLEEEIAKLLNKLQKN